MPIKIEGTDFKLPGQLEVYHGKVRDVYEFADNLLLVATDRYSAFDRSLAVVPDKGALLTGISRWWFEQTAGIIKNHAKEYPDPNAVWAKKCRVVPIEMVVRGYISGVTNTSLWHNYSNGQRDFGDFKLPDWLRKNQQLPAPVLTPTTKFEKHDRPLTPAEAVDEGLVDKKLWSQLQTVALELFTFGQKTAAKQGLLLVDTKYEFGLDENDELMLIDEIHTPDSSRYWLRETYEERLAQGNEPDNYDKEFLRLWFKSQFDPYRDKHPPDVPVKLLKELRRRYIFVYEYLTGQKFVSPAGPDPLARLQANLTNFLEKQ